MSRSAARSAAITASEPTALPGHVALAVRQEGFSLLEAQGKVAQAYLSGDFDALADAAADLCLASCASFSAMRRYLEDSAVRLQPRKASGRGR